MVHLPDAAGGKAIQLEDSGVHRDAILAVLDVLAGLQSVVADAAPKHWI